MKKRIALIRILTTAFLLFFTFCLSAQPADDSSFQDISTIHEFIDIDKCEAYIDSTGTAKPASVPNGLWQPMSNFKVLKSIPNDWINRTIYLRFKLVNSSVQTKCVYFITGYYIRNVKIFKNHPFGLVQLKDESRGDGYQPIILKGKEKQQFLVQFNFSRRLYNVLQPQLIEEDYLNKFKVLKYFRDDGQPIVGFLLSGIMLMMIFFGGANYLQSKKKEFLYNCFYSICMFLLIFLNTSLERKSGFFSSLFHEYLDFMLLLTGTVFYIAFTRKFLETKHNYPLLNKILVTVEKFIVIVLACFTFIVFFSNNFTLQKAVENGMKIIVLVIGIVYIVIALAQKNKLMNYLAYGNAILIFFSLISFCLLMLHYRNTSIFTNSMVYYEVGVVGELIFFLLGLSYKNRIELIGKIKDRESLKLDAEKHLYESRLAILNAQQNERNRISADMHDDLGAGVTAIRLYSELAKKRIGKDIIPEIEKISASANELLNNMNAIIWTMSSSNDSLDNMVAYIRSYSLEYFENTGIDCRIHLDENLPGIPVSGEIRRNIYMVVKEALNNILKHSKASIVTITLKREADGLALYIQDNGTGIDFNNLRRFGNGLKNMKKRMEETQIIFTIENNKGTLITLRRKLEF